MKRQGIRIDNGAADLWTAESAVNDNSLIGEVVAEFGTADTPIDERSGVVSHMKAMVIAAAAAVDGEVTERGYWEALNAIAGDDGSVARRYADDDSVESHCRAASALADLATERLRQAGLKRSDASYADAYIAEVEKCGRALGVPYNSKGA
jgi:hypothetical protein